MGCLAQEVFSQMSARVLMRMSCQSTRSPASGPSPMGISHSECPTNLRMQRHKGSQAHTQENRSPNSGQWAEGGPSDALSVANVVNTFNTHLAVNRANNDD